jgi:hypothetical protein
VHDNYATIIWSELLIILCVTNVRFNPWSKLHSWLPVLNFIDALGENVTIVHEIRRCYEVRLGLKAEEACMYVCVCVCVAGGGGGQETFREFGAFPVQKF